jgi:putative aldouronate transport system substrate-binding protein
MAVLLLSAGPLFATGEAEAGAADMAPGAVLPWTGAEVVYEGFGADLGIQEDPEAPVVQEYRKTTGNVRIEWDTVPWNDYDTKLNLYLQSGDMPDIVWARESVPKAATYGPVGIFLDWDAYREYMPNMQKWVAKFPHVNNVLTDKGERFAINDITTAEYIGEGYFYNANILAQAGIDGPPETMDEWLAQMKQIKAELPDVDPFLTQWGLGYFLHAFGRAMNAKIGGVEYDQELGKWVYGPTQDPNYRKLIEFMHEAYAADAFNLDTIGESVTSDRISELQEEGNYAFTYFYYFATSNIWDYNAGKRPPEGFQGMKPPSFEGKTHYWITVAHDTIPYWGYMASAKVKNPELLAAYVDNIMSEKSSELFEWGVEGLSFRRTDNGGYEYLPEFDEDPAGLRELGVGNFHDPRYIHFNDYSQIWFGKYFTKKDDVGRTAAAADIKRLQAGEMIPLVNWPRPLMSGEQNDEISKIMTPVNTYVEEQRIKFITGDRDMSEWDDFVAEINKLGDIDKVLSYYNGGKQFPMGDRRYPALPADLR